MDKDEEVFIASRNEIRSTDFAREKPCIGAWYLNENNIGIIVSNRGAAIVNIDSASDVFDVDFNPDELCRRNAFHKMDFLANVMSTKDRVYKDQNTEQKPPMTWFGAKRHSAMPG